jgi:Flp pilus assembly pilin Flp
MAQSPAPGQDTVEHTLMAALIALSAILIIVTVGPEIRDGYQHIVDTMGLTTTRATPVPTGVTYPTPIPTPTMTRVMVPAFHCPPKSKSPHCRR